MFLDENDSERIILRNNLNLSNVITNGSKIYTAEDLFYTKWKRKLIKNPQPAI